MHKNRPASFIIDDSACFVNQESEVQEKKVTVTTKPLPLGEVALRSNDGEGKPGTKELLHSGKLCLRQSDTIAVQELFGSILALSGAPRQLSQRESLWQAGPLFTGRLRPDMA